MRENWSAGNEDERFLKSLVLIEIFEALQGWLS